MNDLLQMHIEPHTERLGSNIDLESVEKSRNTLKEIGNAGEDLAVILGGRDKIRHRVETEIARSENLGDTPISGRRIRGIITRGLLQSDVRLTEGLPLMHPG